MVGERLKHVFLGYDAWIISSNLEGFDNIGLKPTSRTKLINGSLDCEYRQYQIFEGKRKESLGYADDGTRSMTGNEQITGKKELKKIKHDTH
jgi:putative N6-adenine-specific DNA methylase